MTKLDILECSRMFVNHISVAETCSYTVYCHVSLILWLKSLKTSQLNDLICSTSGVLKSQ